MVTLPCECCTSVDVYRRRKDDPANEWKHTKAPFADAATPQQDVTATIIIAMAEPMRECNVCRGICSNSWKMPDFWWSQAAKRLNGYYGCDETCDEKGAFEGYNTWVRFMTKMMYGDKKDAGKETDYEWYKFNVFSRWLQSGECVTVFFDPKPELRKDLPSPLFEGDICWDDPYWVHVKLLERLVELQNESVWSIRTLIRDQEKSRPLIARRRTELSRTKTMSGNMNKNKAGATKDEPPLDEPPNIEFPKLHDISRHAIHVFEMMELSIRTAGNLISHHEEFWSDRPDDKTPMSFASKRIRNQMRFYENMLRGLRFRSASNSERLSNEIQLAYNTVAQYDSSISVQIGQAAQVDASAMKTIAFLTLTFLPATFISAIFSMSFFEYNPPSAEDPGGWYVSEKFWVYWVVAVPVTVATVGLWLFWQKKYPLPLIGATQESPAGAGFGFFAKTSTKKTKEEKEEKEERKKLMERLSQLMTKLRSGGKQSEKGDVESGRQGYHACGKMSGSCDG